MTKDADPIIDCPKCAAPMRKLRLEDFAIDRCEKCYGIWLDAGERLKLVARKKLAGAIDIGPEAFGKEQDAITEVSCPRCHVTMEHTQHPDQKHIGFEECRHCGGSFFDAGELRDLSSFSLSDVLRMFVRK